MKIFLCAFIACLFVIYVIRYGRKAVEPEFSIRGILTGEKLGYMLTSLAYASKKTERGNGISLRTVKKRLYTARNIIAEKIAEGKETEECERTFYNNFYKIDEIFSEVKSAQKQLKRLPHAHGVPRLYSLCELVVKSVGGVLGGDTVRSAVYSYSSETPLIFDEIVSLQAMLKLALIEYIAIYADKLIRMSELIEKGISDSIAGIVDYALMRYDSYVYGRAKAGVESILKENCRISGEDVYKKLDNFSIGISEYNARVSAAINSLHSLRSFMTDEFVNSLSGIYTALQSSGDSFENLSQATKRMYLREISVKARKSKVTESVIASEILYKSARENKDISFYILPKIIGRGGQTCYIVLTIAVWLAVFAACVFLPGLGWLYALFGLPILFFAINFLVRKAADMCVESRYLPFYGRKHVDSTLHATTILLPVFAATDADIEDAFTHLGTVIAANPEKVFSYCLLFDYPRNNDPLSENDELLSEKIRCEYEHMQSQERVCILVRARKKADGENYWQGYEKKRGAVMDFNRWALKGEGDFILELGELPKPKYAITLDSDTLTDGCIDLLCAKIHPYCAKTAILSLNCKPLKKCTLFAKLYAGEIGPGRYRYRNISLENDLFGKGNYTGKGIYDIAAFQSALDGFFPDNAILSHDFIEGAVAGCLESSVNAGEEFPQTVSANLKRELRWLRGDWQLLPYTLPRVKNKDGKRISNPLSHISVFQIQSNMIMSFVPIAQMFVFALMLFLPPSALSICLAFLPQLLRIGFSLGALYRYPKQTLLEVVRCFSEIATLPIVAVYKLCAIVVTLFRLITRHKLLEWNISAHAKGNLSFLPNMIAAVIFVASTAVFGLNPFFYVLSAVFLIGAAMFIAADREFKPREKSDRVMAILSDTAKDTFKYFTAQEKMYRLPCDCYQADNLKGWCDRTSPTNIGMALVAYAAAYEMGLTDKKRFTEYISKTVSAVEECEKYCGNLYNWYDCATLKVLPRRFVSSVDSGNFLACLSLMLTYTDGELHSRIQKLIDETDIGILFDNKRELFYIGYYDDLKEYTHNHYDLLGSESALTYLAACAYGKIPKNAFYNLDRHAVKASDISVYSWTGGMFEYLMTRIFIAPEAETLMSQAMQGAVAAQLKFAERRKSNIWGVSECRYNAYDDMGGNLYKAFGIPEIAYSEVPACPPYAPYAAFLALPYVEDDKFSVCASAYMAAGAYGDMGYYDAFDEVPVRSFMTHHQGMIMAACANGVKSDCICRRLQTLPQWRAAKLFINEACADSAEKKRVYRAKAYASPIEDRGIYLCKCGNFSAVVTAHETSVSYAGKTVLRNIKFVADVDGIKNDLLDGEFHAYESAIWKHNFGGILSESEFSVIPSPLSVAVTVKIRNISDYRKNIRISACADPVLARLEDYEAHPAYSKMFIETGEGESGRYIWARRRQDSVTVLQCIDCDNPVYYSGDRCGILGRGRGIESGQNTNPILSGSFSLALDKGETGEFTCCFCVLDNAEKAEYTARLVSSHGYVVGCKGAAKQLARFVPDSAKSLAAKLVKKQFSAVKLDNLPMNRPAITHEVTAANLSDLPSYLAGLKFLYDLGFEFHTVLFCKKRRNEYPSFYFDAGAAVDISGIRSSAGGESGIVVLNCGDDAVYARLKKHGASDCQARRVMFHNGDLFPYSENFEDKLLHAESENPFSLPEVVVPLGIGGFTEDYSYFMNLTDINTPAPWSNIISDGNIGTVVTESGGGFTFGENSRQNKLTYWSNDTVTDEVSEVIALGMGTRVWSVTKKPFTADAEYTVKHALGYSEFTCLYNGIAARMSVYINRGNNCKIYETEIVNLTSETLAPNVMFAICPVLGDFQRNTLPSLEYKATDCGLSLRCGFNGIEAYLSCSRKISVIGMDLLNGKAIVYDKPLKSENYWGICAPVDLAPGESQTVYFALSTDLPCIFDDIANVKSRAVDFYSKLCKVSFDGEYGYLSRWLPYQVYNSRFTGRTGFYQVSGAYGFRDQLQDCLALLYCNPVIVREHIIECARHQFKEGDVQHWWHPPAIGVRTHICDDRLWLPYTVCEYIAFTGDRSILDEGIAFLEDVPIAPQDASVYVSANFSNTKATLFEHCLRAILISMDYGENGLVLMRGGDWNDAMDKVGENGTGTSVWCSMFLYHVIDKFLPYVKDIEVCDKLRRESKNIYGAVCNAYNGDRFLRAYCDDGEVLGDVESAACKIDVLTQSWSIISGIGSAEQKNAALVSAYNILCDEENRIIKLFDPPFTSSEGVGYVGNYPEYVRENGGQYTQAAIWYVWALFESGNIEKANKLLKWLSPANRSGTASDAFEYCVEPYVMAADIYSGKLAGKGGWTWYTGSAAWMYKCLAEKYAGIKIRGNIVDFNPSLPADVKVLNLTFDYNGEKIKVKIINSENKGQWRVRIGEVVYNTSALKLTKGLAGKDIAVIKLM